MSCKVATARMPEAAGGVSPGLVAHDRACCAWGCVLGVNVVSCIGFFFQAEDGIRDVAVTGVQTCALPITRSFEKGRFDLVRIGALAVGRASYDPGWKWSTHVGPIAGTKSCQVEHVGLVVSGRCRVVMDDGKAFSLGPGDLFHIAPGHDSWVEGTEPYVSLHFLGADQYAK